MAEENGMDMTPVNVETLLATLHPLVLEVVVDDKTLKDWLLECLGEMAKSGRCGRARNLEGRAYHHWRAVQAWNTVCDHTKILADRMRAARTESEGE